MTRIKIIVSLGVILSLSPISIQLSSAQSACSPPHLRAWIRGEDNRRQNTTLWFGFDPAATCSVETALCEFEPAEVCGAPSDIACFWWYVPGCGSEYGHDLVGHDYRKLLHQSQIDTFLLSFAGEFPFTFRWSRDSVMKVADSVVVSDAFGLDHFRVRMDLEDSLIVGSRIHDLLIISYRGGFSGTPGRENEAPVAFRLLQNYPNPFNPSTTISYTLPVQSAVTLKVFSLLGQELATLVHGLESPGTKSVRFDGSGLPSGVYFYRLQAGVYSATKMLVITQ
jgi:hypothetical protein